MSKNSVIISITSILISIIGLVTLLSTELDGNFSLSLNNIFVKQIIFVLIGIVFLYLTSKFDYTLLKYKSVVYVIYFSTLLLLFLTLFFGQEVNGARRWITILQIQIQPSEIAKITVVLTTLYIFNTIKETEWKLIVRSFLASLPFIILVYIQPHGSMALLLLVLFIISAFFSLKDSVRNILLALITILIITGAFLYTGLSNPYFILISILGIILSVFMFFARDRWRLPILIVLIGSLIVALSGPIVWNKVLSDYQRERVIALVNPGQQDKDSVFNVEQSKIAIGSGGLFGKGFGNGTQSKLRFLPFHQTDFIFAAYGEMFGFIGTVALLLLYSLLFWKIFILSFDFATSQYEGGLIAIVGLKILIESFINLGTNLGITPATGIPLPLMSAGGTITIVTFISLGLILSILNRNIDREILARD